jgi:hypothetical protein
LKTQPATARAYVAVPAPFTIGVGRYMRCPPPRGPSRPGRGAARAKPVPPSAASVCRVTSSMGPATADAGHVSSVPSRRTISGSAVLRLHMRPVLLRLAASLPCRPSVTNRVTRYACRPEVGRAASDYTGATCRLKPSVLAVACRSVSVSRLHPKTCRSSGSSLARLRRPIGPQRIRTSETVPIYGIHGGMPFGFGNSIFRCRFAQRKSLLPFGLPLSSAVDTSRSVFSFSCSP